MVRARKAAATKRSTIPVACKSSERRLRQSSPAQAEITHFFSCASQEQPDTTLTDGEQQQNLTSASDGTSYVTEDACNSIVTSSKESSLDSPKVTVASASSGSPDASSVSPHHKILLGETGSKQKCRRLNPSQSHNQQITEFFPVRRSARKPKGTLLQERHRDIEEAVLSEREEGLEVCHFPDKGRGVVASRSFARGEFVAEYAGELISVAEARLREARYAADQNTGCYMYYFRHRSAQYCVDATAETHRLGRLVNHSRQGNLQTRTVLVKGKPHLVLVARCDISAGEEVLYDYGDRSRESLRHHPWLAM